MEMSKVRQLAGRPNYLSPTKGTDGVWSSAGAHALRTALRAKSPQSVMGLLNGMDAAGMASVLQAAGFSVSGSAVGQGRDAVFAHAKPALQAALTRGVDGWELSGPATDTGSISREAGRNGTVPTVARNEAIAPLPAMAADVQPAGIVQAILMGSSVRVVPLGEQPFYARASLQMIAAQALQRGIAGFGFDGVAGKFDVPASMAEVVDLHREAASSFAVESTRASLHAWVSGEKINGLSEWVPDSVQRLLHGSVSKQAAEVVISAMNSGTVARHAGTLGTAGIGQLLADKGLDVSAPTIEMRASEMALQIREPDRERGQYFGEVVAQDHRASLIKVNRSEAVELPHAAVDGERAKVGEQLRLNFKGGALAVSKAARLGRASPSL